VIGLLAVAFQLSIVAHAPDSAQTCEAIEVSVAVSGTGAASQLPRLSVPSFAPFDVLRSSPMPHVTYSSANNRITAEYRYVLTTDRAGAFTIPAFDTQLGSETARSHPLQVIIRGGAHPNRPIVVARARIDTSLDVKTSALTLPETVFVGQQANYEVAVFLNETVRERLRRNPTFFPPDMQSMLAYDLPARADPPRRQVGSHCFDALVYQRALFPLMPGRFAIPPAQLVYSLPLSASFFAREETHELQTDSTVLVAVEPPTNGRPADYGGAVGNVHVAAKLDTVGSRVGDPLTLTVRVAGTGNVKLFPRPAIALDWASLVKGDERVQVDTMARKIAGAKEFDWVLTPKVAGELDLPPIKYTFFNPETRRYETTFTSPAHLRVAPGSLASADTARTEALLSLRTRYRGVPSAPLHEHPAFWIALALIPLPAVSLRARERRSRRPAKPLSAAARLTHLTRDSAVARDACEVRRVYTFALAERLGLSPESFTRTGALARALRRRGVSTDIALDAERFLRQLDEAAFSSSGSLPSDSANRAKTLYETVDAEALPSASIAASRIASLGLVLVAVGFATAHARDVEFARRAFDSGVAAYARHDFVAAHDAFTATVRAEPNAPDGWANLGTSAWAVGDTAHSVAAWQRALRIEPLANDVRERVEIAHSLPLTAAGYVPPMPASWIFDLAALLWIGAWGAAAYHAGTGRLDGLRETATIAVIAGGIAIGGFVVSDRLAGRHLAVVRQTTPLRAEPDLGGETNATAIIGEVVRVNGRQGAWSRIILDDGRDGWIETDSVLSLDQREGAQIALQ
jgi:hypothetical protein